MIYAQATHLHPQKERVVLYRVHNQLIYVHKRHECVVLYSGSAKHNFRTPLILRIVHRFKGEDSNIGMDGAHGASRHLFVYVIQMYVCDVYEIK